jgi:DNA polymerase-3 subunit alpha
MILAERGAGGAFVDLYDFCRRVDVRKLNRRVMEALIKAGAMDPIGQGSRASLLAALDDALRMAEQHGRDLRQGQGDLFGFVPAVAAAVSPELPEAAADTEDQVLRWEKETLGLYLTGHPIRRYREELMGLVSTELAEISPGKQRRIAGLMLAKRLNNSKRGRMAILILDDQTARLEVTVYSELMERSIEKLELDRLLVVTGDCREDSFSGGYALVATEILTLDEARAAFAGRLSLRISGEAAHGDWAAALIDILTPHRGGGWWVHLRYQGPEAGADLRLGAPCRIRVTDRLLAALRTRFGADALRMDFGNGQ